MSDYVGAFSLETDGGSVNDTKSAAAYVILNPGLYTVIVSSVDGSGGNAMVEVYDADR